MHLLPIAWQRNEQQVLASARLQTVYRTGHSGDGDGHGDGGEDECRDGDGDGDDGDADADSDGDDGGEGDADADPALFYGGYAGYPYAYGLGLTHPSNVGLCLNYVGAQVPC